MEKYKIIVIVLAIILILFMIGVFSVSVSTGNGFFSTKYHKSPIDAYNDGEINSVIYGDTTVEKEIAVYAFDDENCLFLGQINENLLVANEMEVKNGKYASKGKSYYYDLTETSGKDDFNKTDISDGFAKWTILYSEDEVISLSNILSMKTYSVGTNREIILVILDD